MINFDKPFNIYDYIEIFLRRIWWIIIPLVLAMGGAAAYAKLCPRTYLSSTTILVTPQKVPVDYVRPTVTSRIEDRLHSISQEIMSRTRLEKVIAEFNLYARETKTLAGEEIIELMRKDINLRIGGKEGYFTLSYQGSDPVIVTKVTNRLASLFIEENLKLREQQAQGTTEFLALELAATKAKLEEQEKILTDYRQKHLFELPDRVVTNLGMLTQLRQDHQRVSEALRSAEERKLVIQKQIGEIQKQAAMIQKQAAEIKPAAAPALTAEVTREEAPPQDTQPVSAQAPPGPADRSKEKMSPTAVQIATLSGKLLALQARYTEKHPDILITKKAIKDLEKVLAAEQMQAAKEAKENKPEEQKVDAPPGVASAAPVQKIKEDFDPQAMFTKEMEGQLIVTEKEIQNLKDEEAKIRANIATYQQRVENAPLREMMLTNLSRGYEITREIYRKLLEKSEQARQAENLEKRQKGEQFRLIDPARVPEKPIKPNVFMVLFGGLALGIFSGAGLAVFKEYLDRSFRDARDMEAALDIKVLANIPRFAPKSS
jgi:polysaccharide chain length determinant protein (PEP-CTERM system associated)